MDRTSSSGMDKSTLTKGQLRKLNALRKSVGGEIGERTFAEWLSSQGSGGQKADGNAALIVDTLWPMVEQDTPGDPARRLPPQAGPRADHRRAGPVVKHPPVSTPAGCAGTGIISPAPASFPRAHLSCSPLRHACDDAVFMACIAP